MMADAFLSKTEDFVRRLKTFASCCSRAIFQPAVVSYGASWLVTIWSPRYKIVEEPSANN
jgi:hypothetical protein